MTDERTAVYAHVDAGGTILYIGCSSCPFSRYQQHLSASPWAKQVVRIDIEWFPTRQEALEAELARIKAVQPAMNRQLSQYRKRNNWSGNDGHRYVKAWADMQGLDTAAVAERFSVAKAYAAKLMSVPCFPRMQNKANFSAASDGYVPFGAWSVRPGQYCPVTPEQAAAEYDRNAKMLAGWELIRAERFATEASA